MNEMQNTAPRKPGIVILVAIPNFIFAAFFLMWTAFMALAIVFGAAWGFDAYVSQQISQYAPNPNFSYGLAWLFGGVAAVCLVSAMYFILLGAGLLGGKKFAWYLQVATSTVGLLGLPLSVTGIFLLPLSAIINIVILVLFFQPRIRDYFKV